MNAKCTDKQNNVGYEYKGIWVFCMDKYGFMQSWTEWIKYIIFTYNTPTNIHKKTSCKNINQPQMMKNILISEYLL